MNIKKLLTTVKLLIIPRPYALEKPVVLQFPINDICNSACTMCNIWKNKKTSELSINDLKKGIKNPLFSKVTSIGINGGEPTLREDLPEIIETLYQNLPKLNQISLITNGLKTNQVILRIEESIRAAKKYGGKVDLMVSLDGFETVHDAVRGKKNYFDKATKVINHFKSHPDLYNLRVGYTIIKSNVFGLFDLLDYCIKNDIYVKFRLGIPHKRLYTENITEPYSLNKYEHYHIVEFFEGLIKHYEKNADQIITYRSIINQLIHRAPRLAGCDWQHRGATLTSKGEILYCAVESDSLGHITDRNIEKKYFDGRDHLKDIIKNKCDGCVHDYTGIPPKEEIVNTIKTELKEKIKLLGTLDKAIFNIFFKDKKYKQRKKSLQKINPEKSKVKLETKYSIVICGWYGTETLGDKAILAATITLINECLKAENVAIFVASLNPYITEITLNQFSDHFKNAKTLSISDSIRKIADSSLVIVGGGPLMAIDELADIEVIFETAKKYGIPRMIAGCGIGPWGNPWHNNGIKRILELATVRIYRDKTSINAAKKIGINTDSDKVSTDPAATWIKRSREKKSIASDKKTVLFGLREFPYSQYSKSNSDEKNQAISNRYEESILSALTLLSNTHNDLVFKFLPMCTNHFGDDDRFFYRKILRKRPELAAIVDTSLLDEELTPDQYISEFNRANIVIAMRFHSLVFSTALGIPTICIDYTLKKGKTYDLCETSKTPYQSIDELTDDFIVAEVNKILRNEVSVYPETEDTFSQCFSNELRKVLCL